MGLKKAENQVKILLAETILAMCRNTLNNHAEVSVEGLLGITLDNDEIFLVSINQTINNPDAPSKTRQLNSETSATNDVRDESSSRKRDKTNADGDSSSSDSDEESTRDSKSKRRRRKRKRRRSSKSSNESGSSSESEENDTRPSSPKRSNDNDFSQNPNSFTVMQQEDTSLSNLSETVQIKQERHDEEEEEEDLVIIKEEMSDLPTDNQFLNMQQQFDSSTFQPDFNSSFHQQSLSSDLSQPQPGPSSSNAEEEGVGGDGCQIDTFRLIRRHLEILEENKTRAVPRRTRELQLEISGRVMMLSELLRAWPAIKSRLQLPSNISGDDLNDLAHQSQPQQQQESVRHQQNDPGAFYSQHMTLPSAEDLIQSTRQLESPESKDGLSNSQSITDSLNTPIVPSVRAVPLPSMLNDESELLGIKSSLAKNSKATSPSAHNTKFHGNESEGKCHGSPIFLQSELSSPSTTNSLHLGLDDPPDSSSIVSGCPVGKSQSYRAQAFSNKSNKLDKMHSHANENQVLDPRLSNKKSIASANQTYTLAEDDNISEFHAGKSQHVYTLGLHNNDHDINLDGDINMMSDNRGKDPILKDCTFPCNKNSILDGFGQGDENVRVDLRIPSPLGCSPCLDLPIRMPGSFRNAKESRSTVLEGSRIMSVTGVNCSQLAETVSSEKGCPIKLTIKRCRSLVVPKRKESDSSVSTDTWEEQGFQVLTHSNNGKSNKRNVAKQSLSLKSSALRQVESNAQSPSTCHGLLERETATVGQINHGAHAIVLKEKHSMTIGKSPNQRPGGTYILPNVNVSKETENKTPRVLDYSASKLDGASGASKYGQGGNEIRAQGKVDVGRNYSKVYTPNTTASGIADDPSQLVITAGRDRQMTRREALSMLQVDTRVSQKGLRGSTFPWPSSMPEGTTEVILDAFQGGGRSHVNISSEIAVNPLGKSVKRSKDADFTSTSPQPSGSKDYEIQLSPSRRKAPHIRSHEQMETLDLTYDMIPIPIDSTKQHEVLGAVYPSADWSRHSLGSSKQSTGLDDADETLDLSVSKSGRLHSVHTDLGLNHGSPYLQIPVPDGPSHYSTNVTPSRSPLSRTVSPYTLTRVRPYSADTNSPTMDLTIDLSTKCNPCTSVPGLDRLVIAEAPHEGFDVNDINEPISCESHVSQDTRINVVEPHEHISGTLDLSKKHRSEWVNHENNASHNTDEMGKEIVTPSPVPGESWHSYNHPQATHTIRPMPSLQYIRLRRVGNKLNSDAAVGAQSQSLEPTEQLTGQLTGQSPSQSATPFSQLGTKTSVPWGRICQFCGKVFASRNAVMIHSVVHTGEKNFVCPYCAVSFNTKGNMVRHMQRKHKYPKEQGNGSCSSGSKDDP